MGGSAVTAPSEQELPAHYAVTRAQFLFSGASIATAVLLFGALGVRVALGFDLWQWWVPFALAGGVAAADFGSGLVHWGADTWGRDDLPVIGHRLLVPFRVHHLNPDDFLRRRFVETNGDVAFLALPILARPPRGSARDGLGRRRRRLRLRVLRVRDDDEPDSPVGAHAFAVTADPCSAGLRSDSRTVRACGASRAAV